MTLTPYQIAAMRDVEAAWPDATATLIGAAALGFHLDMSWRMTGDIDLVVALDFDEFPDALLKRYGWSRHSKQSQTFFSPEGCQVDLVPAGPKALSEGFLTWPDDGFEMSVIGLDLAFTHRREIPVAAGGSIYVAPAFVVIFLKMISYLDRPHERERDLVDIAHFMEGYIGEEDERRWSEEVDRDVSYDSVASFLLGMDISNVLTESVHWAKVDAFMKRACDEQSALHAKLAESGSPAWRNLLADRLKQLQAGLNRGRP